MLDTLTSDILLFRGDLDKCSLKIDQEIKDKYLSMKNDNIELGSTKTKLIHNNNSICDEIVQLFTKYMDSNRIIHKNYSSFGSRNIKQNETEISYKIPLEYECSNNVNSDYKLSANLPDEIAIKICYVEIENNKRAIDNFHNYNKLFNDITKIKDIRNDNLNDDGSEEIPDEVNSELIKLGLY